MCNWLEDAINFLFPEPVQQDMDGEPEKQLTATDASLPDIPDFYKRHISVLEPDTETPKSADSYVRSGGD